VDSIAKCNSCSSKADFDVLAKVLEDGLEGCDVAEAFSGGEVAGHDDLLEFVVPEVVNVELAGQPSSQTAVGILHSALLP